MSRIHEAGHQDPSFRVGKRARLVATTAAVIMFAAACTGSGDHKADAKQRTTRTTVEPTPSTVPEERADDIAEQASRETIKSNAIEAARKILGILENPKAGIQPNDRYSIQSDRDSDVPYSYATFNPDTGEIQIGSYNEHEVVEDSYSKWQVRTSFTATDQNPIYAHTIHEQFNASDFIEALSDPRFVEVNSSSAVNGLGNYKYERDAGLSFNEEGISVIGYNGQDFVMFNPSPIAKAELEDITSKLSTSLIEVSDQLVIDTSQA